MFRIIILFLVTLNVYAVERVVPMPDAAERGEMRCFDNSQALHKIMVNIQNGSDPDGMIRQINLNKENAKKNSKLTGEVRDMLFSDLDRVTLTAISLIDLSKRIGKRATPADAQIWYYDFCVIAVNKRLKEINELTNK